MGHKWVQVEKYSKRKKTLNEFRCEACGLAMVLLGDEPPVLNRDTMGQERLMRDGEKWLTCQDWVLSHPSTNGR